MVDRLIGMLSASLTHALSKHNQNKMTRKKIIIPVRVGMPASCIECNGAIHRKSEHYYSRHCENVYKATTDEER